MSLRTRSEFGRARINIPPLDDEAIYKLCVKADKVNVPRTNIDSDDDDLSADEYADEYYNLHATVDGNFIKMLNEPYNSFDSSDSDYDSANDVVDSDYLEEIKRKYINKRKQIDKLNQRRKIVFNDDESESDSSDSSDDEVIESPKKRAKTSHTEMITTNDPLKAGNRIILPTINSQLIINQRRLMNELRLSSMSRQLPNQIVPFNNPKNSLSTTTTKSQPKSTPFRRLPSHLLLSNSAHNSNLLLQQQDKYFSNNNCTSALEKAILQDQPEKAKLLDDVGNFFVQLLSNEWVRRAAQLNKLQQQLNMPDTDMHVQPPDTSSPVWTFNATMLNRHIKVLIKRIAVLKQRLKPPALALEYTSACTIIEAADDDVVSESSKYNVCQPDD